MAVSPHHLQELKRRLLVQYEDDIARVSARGAALALSNDAENSVDGAPLPSASSLSLELLCRRAGLPSKDIALTAREQVVLMANAMPPTEAMVEERLRRAQEESVRLLVRKACAALSPSGKTAVEDESASNAQHEVEALSASPVPVTSAERLQLLEKMYAANMRALSSEVEAAQPV